MPKKIKPNKAVKGIGKICTLPLIVLHLSFSLRLTYTSFSSNHIPPRHHKKLIAPPKLLYPPQKMNKRPFSTNTRLGVYSKLRRALNKSPPKNPSSAIIKLSTFSTPLLKHQPWLLQLSLSSFYAFLSLSSPPWLGPPTCRSSPRPSAPTTR